MKCEIKYAPKSLNEVVYPNAGVENRIKLYASGHLEGHVLLHGPNGTGKSSVARLLIEAIGGSDAHVDKPPSSSFFKGKNLHDYFAQQISFARLTTSSKKYFLLCEEFDALQANASEFWTALDAHGTDMMVIMTTNEPLKVHKSIRSRSDIIDFPGISAAAALQRVQYALRHEGVTLPDAQVLTYLKEQEYWLEIRKYMRVADALIALKNQGQPFPAWQPIKPSLKVI